MVQKNRITYPSGAVQTLSKPSKEPFRILPEKRTSSDSFDLRIEYIRSGKGLFSTPEYSYIVHAGDTSILRAGEEYHFASDSNEPLQKTYVDVTGPLVQRLIGVYRLEDTHLLKNTNSLPYIVRMHEIRNAEERDGKNTGIGAFCELMHFLSMGQKDAFPQSDLVARVREYMDSHVRDSVSVNNLCDMFSVTSTHLIRVFKQEFKVAPYHYFLGLKLEYARIMLSSGDKSIERVAEEAGFSSSTHFSTLFYNEYGVRPSEYRKAAKE